jgi:dienelactone hydrolase
MMVAGRNIMKICLWHALSLLIATVGAAGQQPVAGTPADWPGPGPRDVGFTVWLERDASRPLNGAPRPVQVGCWYPARSRSGPGLTYADYFALSESERDGRTLTAAERSTAIAAYKKLLVENGVSAGGFDAWFATAFLARRDAPPVDGTLPLVLVAQGNFHSLHHQTVLAEHLASHGYLVCSTPSQTRLSGPMQSEDDVAPNARAQAADLQVARRAAAARFTVDGDRLGLVGHSFGSRSSLVLAALTNATALVSLDGGIGGAQAKRWIGQVPEVDLARMRTPVLHLYEDVEEFVTPDFELFERMTGTRRLLVKIDGVRHLDFSALGFVSAAITPLRSNLPPDFTRRIAAIPVYTRAFLDATMKNDAQAERMLARAPAENGFDGWVTVRDLRRRP